MSAWLEQLGPLGYPLLACSFLALALLVERLLTFLFLPRLRLRLLARLTAQVSRKEDDQAQWTLTDFPARWREGLSQLLAAAPQPKALREELAMLWLNGQRKRLLGSLGWLTLLAVLSPLLGLLGTILGMIRAFQSLAAHTGPVHPALLADGLWQAMLTTAVGLFIAIPCLAGAHLFRLWASSHLERLEEALNRLNLAMEGVSLAVPESVQSGEPEARAGLGEAAS